MSCTDVLLLVAGALVAIYFWSTYTFSYWRRKNMPYVEPTPLIGNMKEALALEKSFGLHLSDIYSDPKMSASPVVGIYVLNQPGLVVRDPELIKIVLIKDFNKFSNRYGQCDPHGDALGYNSLFFMRNPRWREMRTKLTPVFTSGKVKQMYPLMLEIASDLETHLASYFRNGNAIVTEIKKICSLFTIDLIATIAFGVRANSLQNPNAEFGHHCRTFFKFNFRRAMEFSCVFFTPKWVPFFRIKFFSQEFSKFLRRTINFVLSERVRSGTTRNDLIDILVGLQQEASSIQGDHYTKNNDFLVAQAAVFLTAGFDTSSTTMSFALYELAKRPDLQKRLRSEIHEALLAEKGQLSYDKINSLEYLSMVLDEVLRLYPVLPFLDRQYGSIDGEPDVTLKPHYDYTLPNGMPVFIPVYGIQRDPKYWPNPHTFDPERFTSENKKLHKPMTYMPFGNGPHSCIGNRIGLLQAKIGLVHMLKNHSVEVCEKTVKEIDFEPKALILQCKGGIYLNLVNDNLYEVEAQKL